VIDVNKIEENERKFEKEVESLIEKHSENHAGSKEWQKTVGAILVENTNVLLVKRGHQPFKGTWTLPGGHINDGETDIKAVIREVKEETGLDFKPEYFGSYEETFDEVGYYAYISIFYGDFKGKIDKKKVDINEILDIQWFDYKELADVKIGYEHRKIIEEYLISQR